MKISIDIDGTLTQYPDFFEELRTSFQKNGHEVGLLTAQHPGQWVSSQIGIGKWNFVITTNDAAHRSEVEKDVETTVNWKKQVIEENKIDLHFDDITGFNFQVK